MDVDPETKRKAEDLNGPQRPEHGRNFDEDPEQAPANQERLHLDEKVEEVIDRAAAKKDADDGGSDR